ncbi:hypothetical protein LAZ67_15001455 [Cordylochernes scorpioides]|uniref:Reverse transcriptase zinc-binding domain-containing protein n=1 Tax=Cordylochernes scorpioides TaxID=51811 RepID=A0ABY6L8R7_9ARAC|nr:hypothetical protein LAZ67_15001455 [Cordylochernes scorpioides]
MLERPRLAAVPISRYLWRWAPVVDVPSTSLAFSSLRRCSFGGHAADIALRLALHALPHPGHPASNQPVCIACGSSDLPLAHRYWSCSAVRHLIREVFSIIGRAAGAAVLDLRGGPREPCHHHLLSGKACHIRFVRRSRNAWNTDCRISLHMDDQDMFQMESRDFPVFQL